jgi:hypothetical protein
MTRFILKLTGGLNPILFVTGGIIIAIFGLLYDYKRRQTNNKKLQKIIDNQKKSKEKAISEVNPKWTKFWNKDNEHFRKLTYFLLNISKQEYGFFDVRKKRTDDGGHLIVIEEDSSWFGLEIMANKFGNQIKIEGISPILRYEKLKRYQSFTGGASRFNIAEKERLKWVLRNFSEFDSGISSYFDDQKKQVQFAFKEIEHFYNFNKPLLESDAYDLLLKKNENGIIELNKDFVLKFVKISNYLKQKRFNIQSFYSSFEKVESKQEIDICIGVLKNEIHLYNLILYKSMNMVVSLISNEMISFYETYDMFDKLDIFNSKWEIELSEKLKNIANNLGQIGVSVNQLNANMVNYLQQLSFENNAAHHSLTKELKSINSSIDSNNLLQLVSTYQLSKINKQTKGA